MAHQHHFHVKTDDWPVVSNTDQLMIVHRNQLAINAVLYIGAHKESVVEIRSATDRETVETATIPATGGSALTIPAGGMVKFDLPGGGTTPLDLVTKLSLLRGSVFVHISSSGEFDTHLKQVDTGI